MRSSFSHLLPKPKSSKRNHNSLSSFLAYAARTGLAKDSTVYKGLHYEYTVLSALRRVGFRLERVGERGDRGVDLRGRWLLPGHGVKQGRLSREGAGELHGLKVLLQCKGFNSKGSKTSPALIRELEGTFGAAPREWFASTLSGTGDDAGNDAAAPGIIALLATSANATKGIREALGRSRFPLGFVKVSVEGVVEQMLWNRRAAALGLEGVNVTVRHRILELGEGRDEAAENDNRRKDFEAEGGSEGRHEKVKANKAAVVRKEVALELDGEIWEPIVDDATATIHNTSDHDECVRCAEVPQETKAVNT